jgi:threonine aldolase
MSGSVRPDSAPIDLRSDTVTRPTAAMRKAMAEAEVGDDVYRDDPTVLRLEEMAAERLGKEAALFVPSGTMGNQIAIKVWTRPGQEVVLEETSHILDYEMGTMAAFSGVLARPLPGRDGALTAEAVRRALRPPIYYVSQTGLVTLENTHNMAGGTIHPQEDAEAICALAAERGIPTHLDGARIFNAAVALGRKASDLARPFGSVMVCLSKGLGAPVGSVVAGPKAFIDEALRVRKRLGGGMRQAGVLAAAGIVALRDQVERLADDHAMAARLARGIAGIAGLSTDAKRVQTNVVIFEVTRPGASAAAVVEGWRRAGVLASLRDDSHVRVLTHYDVTPAAIDTAVERLAQVMKSRAPGPEGPGA